MADKALCSIPECGKPLLCKGLCQTHYYRVQKKGYRPPSKPCGVATCGALAFGRKYCLKHYKRWLKYGDPLAGSTEWGAAYRFIDEAIARATPDECLAWPYSRSAQGAGQVRKGGKLLLVTRIVCERVKGPPPTPQHQAAHSCGKGHEGCINWHHLSWKTQAENEADKFEHGTRHRDRPTGAKLSLAQVEEVLHLRKQGVPGVAIAARFGVVPTTIYSICAKRTWAHVKEL